MHTQMHEAGRATEIRVYLVKRISRIFPAYWPVGLAMLVLYAVLPGVSASGEREISVASSILLLPAEKPPALSVAWTLIHELLFYCVFLLWFASRRAFWSGMAAWVAAIAVTETVGGAIGWQRYFFGLLNVEFLFGVLAAVSYNRGWLAKQDGLLVAGGVLLVLGLLLALYTRVVVGEARLALAFGLGIMMLGLALRERRQLIRWPALLLVLGNASFSIYLVLTHFCRYSIVLLAGLKCTG